MNNPNQATNYRTHYCGELSAENISNQVSVCGWVKRRREHGEKLAFIDLYDHTGIIQCVVDEKLNLGGEFVLKITGTVSERPEGTVNPNIKTGDVELTECEVEILNKAEPPPIPLDERVEVDENLRLRYRYLDLRKEKIQKNLRVRAKINEAFRSSMSEQGFLELETPLLIVSTPEGARDFVVPSRLHNGNFYALPQSPQIFKQLAMVGGIDRYYQIARCLRDEDLRADRQFEFMQLDVEASFVNQEDIIEIITAATKNALCAVLGDEISEAVEFSEMTYETAMENYGSDKPDTRFEMLLTDITQIFENTQANVFKAECLKAINVLGGVDKISRAQIDDLTDFSKKLGAKGLAWFKVGPKVDAAESLDGPLTKFLSADEMKALVESVSASSGDLILVIADTHQVANRVLGQIRVQLGTELSLTSGNEIQSAEDLNFVWVTDFPLFEGLDETGTPICAHHLFTMPHEDDIDLLVTGGGEGMLKARSLAYDLVLNGWELGSGSIRIHKPDIQERVFAALGLSEEETKKRFGYFLDAYKFGAPPHGGFALGIDRFTALLSGEENIREVIAFPKTQTGQDPMTGAPNRISDIHLKELGVQVPPEEK